MTEYINVYAALLRGETVDWDGAAMRMLHPAESAEVPVDVPIYISAVGTKGLSVARDLVARDLAAGLFVIGAPTTDVHDFSNVASLVLGTVLDHDEALSADRVREAAGPGLAIAIHAMHAMGALDAIAELPGGSQWLEVIARTPQGHQHLAVHDGHLLRLNEADLAAWEAGAHNLLPAMTLTGTADAVRGQVEELASQGVTELLYQPVGDVDRELTRMAAAINPA